MNFAKLDGTKVINIEVASQEWVDQQPNKEIYVAYSIENSACVGGDYIDGFFYQPQPYESWTRDGQGNWVSPIPQPQDDNSYYWDEDTQTWIATQTI